MLGDLLKFVIRYRGTRAFIDCSYGEILYKIQQAAHRDNLHTVVENGKITGMIIAYTNTDNTLEIEQLVCSTKSAFKVLRHGCRHIYADMDLCFMRNGKRKRLAAHLI
jgi:hypothetical protein